MQETKQADPGTCIRCGGTAKEHLTHGNKNATHHIYVCIPCADIVRHFYRNVFYLRKDFHCTEKDYHAKTGRQ